MPPGYLKSSQNNAKLVAADKRFRGGPDLLATPSPQSVPVHGDLSSDPLSSDWLGWSWSPWVSVAGIGLPRNQIGLYRLRAPSVQPEGLAYVGQGRIASRIDAHAAKASMPDHKQAGYFSGKLQASWISVPGAKSVHLLEHENDLIASHLLVIGSSPSAQFLG